MTSQVAQKPTREEMEKAVLNENIEAIEDLLRRGADINEEDAVGNDALAQAAEFGKIESMRVLIAHGADVNRQCSKGLTPLMRAAWFGLDEAVQFLVDHGADLAVCNNVGLTALRIAGKQGWSDAEKVLKKAWTRHWAAARPDHDSPVRTPNAVKEAILGYAPDEEILYLLARGADINERDEQGGTALLWAVSDGWYDKVEFLIEQGADVTVRDNEGVTPFLEAVYKSGSGHVECVRILLEALPEEDFETLMVKGKDGKTALAYAKEGGHAASRISDMLEKAMKPRMKFARTAKKREAIAEKHKEIAGKQRGLNARARQPVIIRGMKP